MKLPLLSAAALLMGAQIAAAQSVDAPPAPAATDSLCKDTAHNPAELKAVCPTVRVLPEEEPNELGIDPGTTSSLQRDPPLATPALRSPGETPASPDRLLFAPDTAAPPIR